MAETIHDSPESITVLDPILVKVIPVMQDGEYMEQVVTNNFCAFTKEREFTFNYKDILYCKQLNPVIVKYYKKLVLAFGEETSQTESFYKDATQDEVEKVQQQLTNKSIKLH